MACNGLADPGPTADPLECTGADSHKVRARLARRGAVHGLELDTGDGVVWIPQWALLDLRRRLYLAQQRLTAASGPVPGKRRRPASARA